MQKDEKLTIVGPVNENKTYSFISSVNIEALLLMAKYDRNFFKLLIKDREKALIESEIKFTKNELILLKEIENNILKKTIKNFVIKGINKKSLPNWKKAASVILLISNIITSNISCSSDTVKGITKDEQVNKNKKPENQDKEQSINKPVQKPKPYDEDRITRGISIDRKIDRF